MALLSRISRSFPSSNDDAAAQTPLMSGTGVLRCLGISPADLTNDTVTVSASALVLLLQEVARQQRFDPEFYAENYPDIEAARLAGIVTDLHVHFIESGFIEGRLPHQPAFDPQWYASFYPDLADVFAPGDLAGLRNHFLSAGLAEGRAGTEASLGRVSHWTPKPASEA